MNTSHPVSFVHPDIFCALRQQLIKKKFTAILHHVKIIKNNYYSFNLKEQPCKLYNKNKWSLQQKQFNPWRILKETTEPAGPFGTMLQEPWHPGKGAKPDRVIQLNSGEVCTRASYKTTRTWENFNNWGTKMILLSDELWLIANNFKSLRTGVSQWYEMILINTLIFTLFRTFKNTDRDLMV